MEVDRWLSDACFVSLVASYAISFARVQNRQKLARAGMAEAGVLGLIPGLAGFGKIVSLTRSRRVVAQ